MNLKLNAMKINFNTLVGLMFFTALSFTLNANTSVNDSLPNLEIKGKIAKKTKAKGTYKVELLYNDIVIDTKEVNDKNAFSFNIPSYRNYTIKILKAGYNPKVIAINKDLYKSVYSGQFYKCEFTTRMEESRSGR